MVRKNLLLAKQFHNACIVLMLNPKIHTFEISNFVGTEYPNFEWYKAFSINTTELGMIWQ